MTNKDMFNSLCNGTAKLVEITPCEVFPIITSVEKEIFYRLEKGISYDDSQDIICMRNFLENLNR